MISEPIFQKLEEEEKLFTQTHVFFWIVLACNCSACIFMHSDKIHEQIGQEIPEKIVNELRPMFTLKHVEYMYLHTFLIWSAKKDHKGRINISFCVLAMCFHRSLQQ